MSTYKHFVYLFYTESLTTVNDNVAIDDNNIKLKKLQRYPPNPAELSI